MTYLLISIWFLTGVICSVWIIKFYTEDNYKLGKLRRGHIFLMIIGGVIAPITVLFFIVGLVVSCPMMEFWSEPLFPKKTKVKPYVKNNM